MKELAIITGANRGMGEAIASSLAESGLDVIGTDRKMLDGFDAKVARETLRVTSSSLEGARTPVFLSLLEGPNASTGRFFRDERQVDF